MEAPLPLHEAARLRALENYRILDTLEEQCFQDIVELAAHICQAPIALISLVDRDRQWFKARIGLQAAQTPRELAFCAHAILSPGEVLEVPDAAQDRRFADNPLVTGDPRIRFYAGAPLAAPSGDALGTICVIDRVPRSLSPAQTSALRALSRQVVAQLELRRIGFEIADEKKRLETILAQREAELGVATQYLMGMIAPNSPLPLDWLYRPCGGVGGDGLGAHALEGGALSIFLLDACGHGIGAAVQAAAALSVLRPGGLSGVDYREPAKVLSALNRAFPMERNDYKYFTIWYGVYDLADRSLRFAASGHPPALLRSGNGEILELHRSGNLIGHLPDALFAEGRVQLPIGAMLLLYSDGVTESRDAQGHEFGLERLGEFTARYGDEDDFLQRLETRLLAFGGERPLEDDVALLRLRIP
ncbi:MAG: SpoIIE family protein phosphatase [Spirochaetes bacterium]|nr:SpoIIE family protein phosphatase [Spirochaetota bacterium]